MIDAMQFWLAKQVVEVGLFVALAIAILGGIFLYALVLDFKQRRRE